MARQNTLKARKAKQSKKDEAEADPESTSSRSPEDVMRHQDRLSRLLPELEVSLSSHTSSSAPADNNSRVSVCESEAPSFNTARSQSRSSNVAVPEDQDEAYAQDSLTLERQDTIRPIKKKSRWSAC